MSSPIRVNKYLNFCRFIHALLLEYQFSRLAGTDSSVTFCAYSLDHPMDSDSKFVLRTSGKTAKKALTEACTDIAKDLEELNTEIKKALK